MGKGGPWQQGLDLAVAWNRRKAMQEVRGLEEGGKNGVIPAELGQESQASSCLRKGTPLASRVAQGVPGPSSSCVWTPRVFADT